MFYELSQDSEKTPFATSIDGKISYHGDVVISYFDALSSKTGFDAVVERTDYDIAERVSLADTAKAARFIYSGGSTAGYSFMSSNNLATNNESKFFDRISDGKAAIMLLTSVANPDDMTLARYVVICGVGLQNHTYKIMNPIDGTTSWIAQDLIYNGGAIAGSDVKFTGAIIEFQ